MVDTYDAQRRVILQLAAGLAAAVPLGASHAASLPSGPAATAKAGDFDFLNGNWNIKHRQLKDRQWDQFNGEASVHSILGGRISVEELRIPERNFSGMGLRVLDPARLLWADYWCNAKTGVLNAPTLGSFVDGAGTWVSRDMEDGKPVLTRGVWDRITPRSCRWHQGVSRDDGASWDDNWVMQWDRV